MIDLKNFKLNKYLARYLKDTKRYTSFKKQLINRYKVQYRLAYPPNNPLTLYVIITGNTDFCDKMVKQFENDITNKFKTFLYENNIKKTYELNKVKHGPKGTYKHSVYFKYTELINYAFNWSETKEGWAFWSDINEKWKNIFTTYMLDKLNQ